MNSKERVLRAIERTGPDIVPLYYAQDREKSDVILLPTGRPQKELDNGLVDEWGCWWPKDETIGMTQVQRHPLDEPGKLDGYRLPMPDLYERMDEAGKLAKTYPDRFLVSTATGLTGLNRMISLCGFEQILVHIASESDFFASLFEKIKNFEIGMINQAIKVDANGFIFADDWGTQQSLFISPAKWRKLFKPVFREQFGHAHDHGLKVFFHSCGYIWEIIDDLIEIGVDVLNMEQLNLFGIDRVAKHFGGRVCFLSNPDSQATIPGSRPEQVISEVKELIQKLGCFSGGFIGNADCTLAHKCIPTENVRIMAQAFEEYRYMFSDHA
ncbi:MAG: uroporphyrinogen decarboxylase family protein [Planctomycetota bacterium]